MAKPNYTLYAVTYNAQGSPTLHPIGGAMAPSPIAQYHKPMLVVLWARPKGGMPGGGKWGIQVKAYWPTRPRQH